MTFVLAPSRLRIIVLLSLGLSQGLSPALHADWPRWRGPDGTGYAAPGQTLPAALPEEPKVLWKTGVGFGLGSPAVSGGRLFYLDNQNNKETVHALDAATGKELWNVPLDDVMKDSQSAPGPRSTPLVDGERVYVQSCRGELQCLNTADGKLIWHTNYVKDFGATFTGERGPSQGASRHGYTGSPLLEGDRLITAAGGPEAGVVCLNKKTGDVIWKSQGEVAGYTGPIAATIGGVRQFVVFTAKSIMGLKADNGQLLWHYPIATDWGRHAATPVVVGDMVVVSSHQAGLMGLKIAKKADGLDVSRAWLSKDLAINFSSPVAVGEWVYGVSPGKTLFCVNAKTGEPGWVKERFFSGAMRRDYAGLIVARDKILALSDAGQLSLIAADPKECRDLGRAQVCGDNWCNPAFDAGKLWLRDNQEMRCVQITP